jgi:hypothetical protein
MYGKEKQDQPKYKVLEPALDIKTKLVRTHEIQAAADWLKSHGLLKDNPQRDHLRDQLLLRRGFQNAPVAIGSIQTVKFVGVGDGAVGKTCFWIRLATGQFPGEYIPTVFDNYSDTVVFGDTLLSLGYWVRIC